VDPGDAADLSSPQGIGFGLPLTPIEDRGVRAARKAVLEKLDFAKLDQAQAHSNWSSNVFHCLGN